MLAYLVSIVRKYSIWIASILCLSISHCKDFEDCRSIYTSIVYLELIASNKSNTPPIIFDALEVESSTTKRLKNTGQNLIILPNSSKNTSQNFIIPLNPGLDYTTVYLHVSQPSVKIDTLTIYYQRYPSLLSPLCGAQQEYILDSLYTTLQGYSILNKTLKSEFYQKNTADVQLFY